MIPFVDLKAQYESIRHEIEPAVLETLASTQYVLGCQVSAFEEEFAAYVEAEHAVGVSSGTSALHLALLAAGIGAGDEVITVSSTFVATVAAIDYTGARPIFVEVEPQTLTMDPTRIESAVTDRTKAVLPVHLHGHPADMGPILEIASRHNLLVIEDAAQAVGAEYQGRRVGAIGALGCFSFYPGKNLGACGEGGMVVTNDGELAKTVRMLRDWGQEKKYHHAVKAYNYRMDAIQGAVLRVKLRHLEEWTEARRRHAEQYTSLLSELGMRVPVERSGCRHVYHVYSLRTTRRDALQAWLGENQIHTGIHYPIPVHMQRAYAHFGPGEGNLPITEAAAQELLSLPMFAELGSSQIETVASIVHERLPHVETQ